MPIADLTEREQSIIGECLRAAVEGPFFACKRHPGAYCEFQTLFGFRREEVQRVAAQWPDINEGDRDAKLAAWEAMVQLTGYPHRCDSEWSDWISVSRDELLAIDDKWYEASGLKEERRLLAERAKDEWYEGYMERLKRMRPDAYARTVASAGLPPDEHGATPHGEGSRPRPEGMADQRQSASTFTAQFRRNPTTLKRSREASLREQLARTPFYTEACRILFNHDPAGLIAIPAVQRDEYGTELVGFIPELAKAESSEDVRHALRRRLLRNCGGHWILTIEGETSLCAAAWELWRAWQATPLEERERIIGILTHATG